MGEHAIRRRAAMEFAGDSIEIESAKPPSPIRELASLSLSRSVCSRVSSLSRPKSYTRFSFLLFVSTRQARLRLYTTSSIFLFLSLITWLLSATFFYFILLLPRAQASYICRVFTSFYIESRRRVLVLYCFMYSKLYLIMKARSPQSYIYCGTNFVLSSIFFHLFLLLVIFPFDSYSFARYLYYVDFIRL